MPKKPIDYSKACIYKIVCKDVSIKDCYVGSTTNLTKRKAQHRENCIYSKYKKHNYPVYQFIRENGGWLNWDVVLIETYPECSGYADLGKRERYWIETLEATLNKTIPTRTDKEWYEENKEAICEKIRQYRKNYPELLKEQDRRKYLKNIDTFKIKTQCECGSIIASYSKRLHLKSQKHQSYIENNITQ